VVRTYTTVGYSGSGRVLYTHKAIDDAQLMTESVIKDALLQAMLEAYADLFL